MRVLKLSSNSLLSSLVYLSLSIVGGFAVGAVMILAVGANPLQAFYALYEGAVGNTSRIAETLVKATPLLFTSASVLVAFRCGMWNIGAEGQLILGAVAATGVGIFLDLPAFVLLPLCFIGSFLAGALWAAVPGVLRVRLNISEIVITVMLNFVAIYLLAFLVTGPWRDPTIAEAFTPLIAAGARLPRFPGTRLNMGIFIALLSVIFLYLLLLKTPFGYRVRAVGSSLKTARYAGIKTGKTILIAMALSGGLAGLGGMCEISGIYRRMLEGISSGYGYLGIPIALLGRLHPLGIILSSLFFAALINGADTMQRLAGVPVGITYTFWASIVIFVLVSDYFRERKKG